MEGDTNGRRIRHMEQEFKRESIFISSSKLYELHCISPIWFKLVLIEVKKNTIKSMKAYLIMFSTISIKIGN